MPIEHDFLNAFSDFKDSSDPICTCQVEMTHLEHLAHGC